MQETTSLYRTIVAGPHWFETAVSIDGHEIAESGIRSLSRSRPGMSESKPTVGGAHAAVLTLKIDKPNFTIPRLAEIVVSVRARNSTQTSDWIGQGIYYIDTRKHNEAVNSLGTVDITAYDAMMKAEADYPNTSHSWPYLDKSVVAEIASAIGVTVDARTNQFLSAGYMIDLPSSYTMRETLEHIAGAYGGNFIITSGGTKANPQSKLLFVPIYGFDYEEKGTYLADENGNALTFGNEGWYILV